MLTRCTKQCRALAVQLKRQAKAAKADSGNNHMTLEDEDAARDSPSESRWRQWIEQP